MNQNVKRIFDEMVERSERPPNCGKLKAAPTPARKTGAAKSKSARALPGPRVVVLTAVTSLAT